MSRRQSRVRAFLKASRLTYDCDSAYGATTHLGPLPYGAGCHSFNCHGIQLTSRVDLCFEYHRRHLPVARFFSTRCSRRDLFHFVSMLKRNTFTWSHGRRRYLIKLFAKYEIVSTVSLLDVYNENLALEPQHWSVRLKMCDTWENFQCFH